MQRSYLWIIVLFICVFLLELRCQMSHCSRAEKRRNFKQRNSIKLLHHVNHPKVDHRHQILHLLQVFNESFITTSFTYYTMPVRPCTVMRSFHLSFVYIIKNAPKFTKVFYTLSGKKFVLILIMTRKLTTVESGC